MSAKKRFRITVQGRSYDVEVEVLDDDLQSAPAPLSHAAASIPAPAEPKASDTAEPPAAPGASVIGSVPSPLSGTVMEIHVAAGQQVKAGDLLVTLEAMKMNTRVSAPKGGEVVAVHARLGATVEEGQALVTLA